MQMVEISIIGLFNTFLQLQIRNFEAPLNYEIVELTPTNLHTDFVLGTVNILWL